MQTINIAEAKTAELVSFYNENVQKVSPDAQIIKKFADRATAEKRVADLIAKLEEIDAETAAPDASNGKADTNVHPEPVANDEEPEETDEERAEREEKESRRAAQGGSAFNALQSVLSSIQSSPQTQHYTPSSRSTAKASNSEGVAATWADAEVRKARLHRDGVEVKLDGKVIGQYKSTRDAFRANRLPDNKHIRFRLKLKEAHRKNGGSETFEHNGKKYVFSIVQIDAE